MRRTGAELPDAGRQLQAWRPADWPVAADWQGLVETFIESSAGQRLGAFIAQRLQQGATIYPPEPLRALRLTPRSSVRVVILGQDPYHGPGQAEGLAFSVPEGVAAPPSLRNIHKELQRDLGQARPMSASLLPWTGQGMLLLNTCLTVEDGQAASHAGRGWETFTDEILAAVAGSARYGVYMLWGGHAQKKAALIEQSAAAHGHEALILSANHPSPLSANRGPAPFIGCGHFSKAVQWLIQRGEAIDWRVEQ